MDISDSSRNSKPNNLPPGWEQKEHVQGRLQEIYQVSVETCLFVIIYLRNNEKDYQEDRLRDDWKVGQKVGQKEAKKKESKEEKEANEKRPRRRWKPKRRKPRRMPNL